MKIQIQLGLVAAMAAMLSVRSVSAFTDVCTLANTELPRLIDVSSHGAYQAKLRSECALSGKYQQMVRKARNFGVGLEQISEYQALRYIERGYYSNAKLTNTPVPLIYQLFEKDYHKDINQRSSIIWDGFARGISQLEIERARIDSGGTLGVRDVQKIHRGFYELSDEVGDYSHAPSPGLLKRPGKNDRYWWRLKDEEVDITRMIVADVNATFASYGLLLMKPLQNEIISVRSLGDGTYGIYTGDSLSSRMNLEQLLKSLNQALGQARAGQHMVWNNRLVTPAEVALLSQQLFVDIHPFDEGNGRVSRFIQELVLTLFGLPHGASGDLMTNDVLTRQADYYAKAIAVTHSLLLSVDDCLEKEFFTAARFSRAAVPVIASALDQSTLDYYCRILGSAR